MSPQWWTGRDATPALVSWSPPGTSIGWRCCREETAHLKKRSWRQQRTMPQPSSSTTTPLTRQSGWDTKVRNTSRFFQKSYICFIGQKGWETPVYLRPEAKAGLCCCQNLYYESKFQVWTHPPCSFRFLLSALDWIKSLASAVGLLFRLSQFCSHSESDPVQSRSY